MNPHLNGLRTVLMDAQLERPARQDMVNGELDWVLYERHCMLTAVNQLRANLGLDPDLPPNPRRRGFWNRADWDCTCSRKDGSAALPKYRTTHYEGCPGRAA